ncbi:MAG: flavodoxin [Lachnospiraceae bacterium]|nr:flavodoxin [Lachnospiraceae bacterium]
MKEVYVVYWSSTGNTQAMAEAIGAGVNEAGGSAKIVEVSSIQASELKDQACFALGASAMGAEELDGEMDAFVSEVETFAAGKQIALFGSYDWGDGEWMRSWADRMSNAGASIVGGEGLIANLAPDDEAVAACRALGAELVK